MKLVFTGTKNLWSFFVVKGLEAITQGHEKISVIEAIAQLYDPELGKVQQMLTDQKECIKNCGYGLRSIKIRAVSRVLSGLSTSTGKPFLEIGFSFDPLLNVPFLPSSTIKGSVRTALFELLMNKGSKKEDAESVCNRLFGDNMSAGLLGFTDAYPVEKPPSAKLLHPDVLTPHYTDETRDELDVSPTPVQFFTVAPGTVFQFYLFYQNKRGKRTLQIRDGNDGDLSQSPVPHVDKLGLVDLALLYAFYRGVGAKTSVGYSRFEVVEYVKL